LLTYEEITRVVNIFTELGVSKVRLTGGEPLLRRDILSLTTGLGKLGLKDLPISTNGHLLPGLAKDLKESGVTRVNISLDTLKADRFKEITGVDGLSEVLAGINSALLEGLGPVKINMVVMKGVNDDEIEDMMRFCLVRGLHLRFIETMPIGSAGISAVDHHYSEEEILNRLSKYDLKRTKSEKTAGPAKNYKVGNTDITVGVISAVSNSFCGTCNRVRLTAKGELVLCLGQGRTFSLRDAIRSGKTDEEVKDLIKKAVLNKPKEHYFNIDVENIIDAQMVTIGG
jgi:cyclic pyranopterin phosphate synthase